MKINRNFNEFTDFESLELEVPTFCFVTGCVSARRDRRYIVSYNMSELMLTVGFRGCGEVCSFGARLSSR
jgi:hypothetical protein